MIDDYDFSNNKIKTKNPIDTFKSDDFNLIDVVDRYIDHQQYLEDKRKYLLGDIYKAKKILILERDNYTCQSCGSTKNLQVHHIKYKNLYNEPLEDLITLCGGKAGCHNTLHKKLGYDKNTEYPINILKKEQLWQS